MAESKGRPSPTAESAVASFASCAQERFPMHYGSKLSSPVLSTPSAWNGAPWNRNTPYEAGTTKHALARKRAPFQIHETGETTLRTKRSVTHTFVNPDNIICRWKGKGIEREVTLPKTKRLAGLARILPTLAELRRTLSGRE